MPNPRTRPIEDTGLAYRDGRFQVLTFRLVAASADDQSIPMIEVFSPQERPHRSPPNHNRR
jgi:hypothetical protein